MVRLANPWNQYPTISATAVGALAGVTIPATRYIPGICEWSVSQALGTPRELYITVALMAGTMTGIVITNLTILTTWWTNPRMRLITSSPRHADNIWNQLKTVIWLLLATAMISLAARQIDTDSDPSPWVAWPFWIASVATLLNFVRFIRTMIGIATIIRNPPSSRDDRAES